MHVRASVLTDVLIFVAEFMDVFVFDCVYECRPPAKMNLGQVIPGSKHA